ncbi:MAG: gamma-glutamylcyclotransferase [Gemmatimonadetes bacterium]|nr:gamma-glutamylcyclotransferase [Gemmatimonadota bacterium]
MNLFVYGSLRRDTAGLPHPLMATASFIGAATVAGRLYRVSWHPGLILDATAGRVHGELFRFPAGSEAALAALDDYEGDMFALTAVRAQLNTFEELEARTYTWRGDPATATLVADGDWGARETGPLPGPTR